MLVIGDLLLPRPLLPVDAGDCDLEGDAAFCFDGLLCENDDSSCLSRDPAGWSTFFRSSERSYCASSSICCGCCLALRSDARDEEVRLRSLRLPPEYPTRSSSPSSSSLLALSLAAPCWRATKTTFLPDRDRDLDRGCKCPLPLLLTLLPTPPPSALSSPLAEEDVDTPLSVRDELGGCW